MNSIKIGLSEKTVLHIGYLFIFLILIDFPLVGLYSLTHSVSLVKILLYSSEAIIMIIFAYLLFNSFKMKLPVFIYIYVAYILLIALVSLLFYDSYGVARDARRFLAPLPPLLLGYYFAHLFAKERERYVNKIIIFLSVLSIISLIEWIWFYLSYDSAVQFSSKYFQTGPYYWYVKHTSRMSGTGLVTSGLTQHFIFIPGFHQFKRATGLYMEGYSAGLNAVAAIILILYSRIAKYRPMKRNYIFVAINLIAVILATSRSAYLVLFVALFSYLVIERKFPAVFLLFFLPFFYGPFRDFCIKSMKTLGGVGHRDAILSLPGYLSAHIFSFKGLMGSGLGSFKDYTDAGLIKEIFCQLGLFGLSAVFILYFSIMSNVYFSKENKFFVLSALIAFFLLSIYSGRIFGYKCFGIIHFFLGYIMKTHCRSFPRF